MAAQPGERVQETADFYCAKCNAVRGAHGVIDDLAVVGPLRVNRGANSAVGRARAEAGRPPRRQPIQSASRSAERRHLAPERSGLSPARPQPDPVDRKAT